MEPTTPTLRVTPLLPAPLPPPSRPTLASIVRVMATSLAHATYASCREALPALKFSMLGYYENLQNPSPPSDYLHVVLRIVLWLGGIGWNIVTTTTQNTYRHIYPSQGDLNVHVPPFMNPRHMHLASDALSLDMSQVPDDITLERLKTFWEDCNTTDPSRSDYVDPEGRSRDDLTHQLDTLIGRIRRKTPFLGTPPAHDITSLNRFYAQLENLIRLSLYHLGTRDQQDQGRFALDMAIAGGACGARWMAEAAQAYDRLSQQETRPTDTLNTRIQEELILLRRNIVSDIAQTSPHTYNAIMGSLGPMLGIPGTADIIESLTSISNQKMMLNFFKRYTRRAIIDRIQHLCKTSGTFRALIVDWVKAKAITQEKEWYPVVESLCHNLEAQGLRVDILEWMLIECGVLTPDPTGPITLTPEELITLHDLNRKGVINFLTQGKPGSLVQEIQTFLNNVPPQQPHRQRMQTLTVTMICYGPIIVAIPSLFIFHKRIVRSTMHYERVWMTWNDRLRRYAPSKMVQLSQRIYTPSVVLTAVTVHKAILELQRFVAWRIIPLNSILSKTLSALAFVCAFFVPYQAGCSMALLCVQGFFKLFFACLCMLQIPANSWKFREKTHAQQCRYSVLWKIAARARSLDRGLAT